VTSNWKDCALSWPNATLNALTTRRYEATAAIHAARLKFHEALGRLTAAFQPAGGPNEEVALDAVAGAARDFNEEVTHNRIFLTNATATKIAKIREMLIVNSNRFQFTVSMQHRDQESWREMGKGRTDRSRFGQQRYRRSADRVARTVGRQAATHCRARGVTVRSVYGGMRGCPRNRFFQEVPVDFALLGYEPPPSETLQRRWRRKTLL
jgi:hypothetical protein